MDSPSKNAKLVVNDAENHEEIPDHVLENIRENSNFIFYSLLFLNGSVLWAYYSCLSAQDYYSERFKGANFEFPYLTTPISTWPMFVGHTIQMFFGLDKAIGLKTRVFVGYGIFMVCAVVIMLQDAMKLDPNTGAIITLICFGVVGLTNSLTESVFYSLSALFPDASFTNAVQIGNASSGVINITLNTLIRLAVGGTSPSVPDFAKINSTAFFIFFSIMIIVCIMAIVLYLRLVNTPCVKYLIDRNSEETQRRIANRETLSTLWGRLFRIAGVIFLPMFSQFMIFFVSLTLFPGIGCSSSVGVAGKNAKWVMWYCAPGIIMSYNFGDFFGRLLASKRMYEVLSLRLCFILSMFRWVFLVLLLMGLPGFNKTTKELFINPLYAFSNAQDFGLFWQPFMNFLVGITTGLLSTVTIGLGPRMVPQEDRESAGALMVMGLFLGISGGATLGWQFGANNWFGA